MVFQHPFPDSQNNYFPDHYNGKFYWSCTGAGLRHKLPDLLFKRVAGNFALTARYDAEAEAFAALGRGLRSIFAEVPPLKGTT